MEMKFYEIFLGAILLLLLSYVTKKKRKTSNFFFYFSIVFLITTFAMILGKISIEAKTIILATVFIPLTLSIASLFVSNKKESRITIILKNYKKTKPEETDYLKQSEANASRLNNAVSKLEGNIDSSK